MSPNLFLKICIFKLLSQGASLKVSLLRDECVDVDVVFDERDRDRFGEISVYLVLFCWVMLKRCIAPAIVDSSRIAAAS